MTEKQIKPIITVPEDLVYKGFRKLFKEENNNGIQTFEYVYGTNR